MDLTQFIRDVPDFPKPGIVFKDIAPLLENGAALRATIDALRARVGVQKIDKVIGIESRGFLFGVPLALELGVGFVPVRKPGKLPWKTHSIEYDLEYGTDTLEIHADGIARGERVLLVDDLLATGGTMAATRKLVEKLEGTVAGCLFVVELGFLNGRKRLGGVPVESLIRFD